MAAAVSATTIVPNLLDLDGYNNYEDWSVYMKNYLVGQHLWSIVEHGIPSASHLVSPLDKAKNAAALHAIHITCSPSMFAAIRGIGSAKEAWEQIARRISIIGLTSLIQEEQSSYRDESNTEEEKMSDYNQLIMGMWKGEWDVVSQFLEKYPMNTIVSDKHGTALHVAIMAGQDVIAEKLVGMMSIEDLQIQNTFGHTALHTAAFKARINLAKCIVQKHPQLVTYTDSDGSFPIALASRLGHGEITRYLYSVTPPELLRPENDTHGFELLNTSIRSKLFDISLDLLQRSPNLTVHFLPDKSPFVKLSTQTSAFYSGCRLPYWQRQVYHLIKVKLPNIHQSNDKKKNRIPVLDWFLEATSIISRFLGIKEIYDLKLNHLYALQVLRCMCNYASTLNFQDQMKYQVFDAIHTAAMQGTYEFPIEIYKVIPPMNFCFDAGGRNFFMLAIQYRQEKVFNLIYDISDSLKYYCIILCDNHGNNLLHAAGELAPAFQLCRVSGEALQMQRELQWFKEVEKFTPTHMKEAKNADGLTPREIFTKNHKELLKEGEKWMKDTASSFIIVGALIVTIMFAVAFTVPGGNDQNTGFPMFLGKISFKIFFMSDAISFFTASTSVLMFLGILTTRYAEEDFLVSLPTKLIIGLSSLFISTAAMMISFSTTLVIMLQGQRWAIIPILLMAGVPVTLFVWLQFPLLVRIFISTYGRGIFGKKVKVHPQ